MLFEFSAIHPQEIALETEAIEKFDDIAARVTIRKTTLGWSGDFEVCFAARFLCGRCLEIFSRTCKVQLHLVYVQGQDPHTETEKVALRAEDVDRIYFTGTHIDLGIGIREAIVLSIPLAPLCREDCSGLCPVCGKNRNTYACTCVTHRTGVFTPQVPLKKKKGRPS